MTSNLQADHNSNFKQNIFNEIDNGRKLYKENKNPKVRYLSLEKKINDDDELRPIFLDWFCKILGRSISNLVKIFLPQGGRGDG